MFALTGCGGQDSAGQNNGDESGQSIAAPGPNIVNAKLTLDNCPIISSPGNYVMNEDYSGAPNSAEPLDGHACVKIIASNVVFNCNGHSIVFNGPSETTYGIAIIGPAEQIKIKNCLIEGYFKGIYLYQTNDSIIELNDFVNNSGFNSQALAISGERNIVEKNEFSDNDYGILIESGSSNIITKNDIHNSNEAGVYASGQQDIITKNSIVSNNDGIYACSSIVSENTVNNNLNIGIVVSRNCRDTTVSNNRIYKNLLGIVVSRASTGNIISDNEITENTRAGIAATFGDNPVTFQGNTVCNNLNGVDVLGNNNAVFNDNIVCDNTQYGFRILGVNNILRSNFIFGNGVAGTNLLYANGFEEENDRYYDNANDIDIALSPTANSAGTLNLNQVTFSDKLSSTESATHISIEDYMESGTSLKANWFKCPSNRIINRVLFGKRCLKFDSNGMLGMIDKLTFHWLDSELGQHNENNFELWRYDEISGWTIVNNNPDTEENYISITNASPYYIYTIMEYYSPSIVPIKLEQ